MDKIDVPNPEYKNLELDQSAQLELKNARNWANFLAIMGFVMMGIMLLFINNDNSRK